MALVSMDIEPLDITPSSPFAYVTLVANTSQAGKRHYLMGAVVAAQSIRAHGTPHDIVFLVMGHISQYDLALLKAENIKVVQVMLRCRNRCHAHFPLGFSMLSL